jgi:hypothetical protein
MLFDKQSNPLLIICVMKLRFCYIETQTYPFFSYSENPNSSPHIGHLGGKLFAYSISFRPHIKQK